MSSGAGPCTKSKRYWKPEQPPPSTLTRISAARSARKICAIRRAARSLKVMDGSLIGGLSSLRAGRPAMSRLSRTVQGNIGWRQGLSIDRSRKSKRHLAPYAVDERQSRGRLVPETTSPTRSLYARDRDRILHSTAFRRLTHKTQVFIYHEGDHYRTRLTHSLEVAQIARSIARTLRLDEDLTEALALAHDRGHPPFGHSGERALASSMARAGGFDHNAQSLRVVTALEKKYARFDGLNLTWETLEGLVKHNGPLRGPNIPEAITDYCAKHDLELETYASLEAQVASLADDIAYNNHDIDDGYRAGLFTVADLAEVPLVGTVFAEVAQSH